MSGQHKTQTIFESI